MDKLKAPESVDQIEIQKETKKILAELSKIKDTIGDHTSSTQFDISMKLDELELAINKFRDKYEKTIAMLTYNENTWRIRNVDMFLNNIMKIQ